MKKRIAYVVHSLNLGGTERLAADMALALQKEYDIRIICLDEPGIWADPVRAAGIPVISLPPAGPGSAVACHADPVCQRKSD